MSLRVSFRPGVESLEARDLPAVTFHITDLNANGIPDLVIVGSKFKEGVKIVDDPAANKTLLSVDSNGDGDFTDAGDVKDELLASGFEVIEVRLGRGSDSLEYITASNYAGTARDLRFDLGSGHDSVTFQLAADVAADVTFKGQVLLGGGHDRFNGNVNLSKFAVHGSLDLLVHGGAGNDVITFTHGVSIGPAPIDGRLALALSGGEGRDRLTVDFGTANAIDLLAGGRLVLRTLGGANNDTTLVNLHNSPSSAGTYDVQMYGNGGNDLLSLGLFDESGLVSYETGAVLMVGGEGRDVALLALGQDAPITKVGIEN